jgi:hypothetical protein
MAEYKGIKGFKVQTVSTDPAASAIAGGTWASGGNLNTAKRKLWEVQEHKLQQHLEEEITPSADRCTESYNGSSWTEQQI